MLTDGGREDAGPAVRGEQEALAVTQRGSEERPDAVKRGSGVRGGGSSLDRVRGEWLFGIPCGAPYL